MATTVLSEWTNSQTKILVWHKHNSEPERLHPNNAGINVISYRPQQTSPERIQLMDDPVIELEIHQADLESPACYVQP